MNRSNNTQAHSQRESAADFIAALLAGLNFAHAPEGKPQERAIGLSAQDAQAITRLLEGTLKRMIALDGNLTPQQLEARYDPEGEGFEHPYAGYSEWRAAVAAEETTEGYWAWIAAELDYQACLAEKFEQARDCAACA